MLFFMNKQYKHGLQLPSTSPQNAYVITEWRSIKNVLYIGFKPSFLKLKLNALALPIKQKLKDIHNIFCHIYVCADLCLSFLTKSLISLYHKILDSIFPLRLRYFQSQSRHSVSDIPSFVREFYFTSQSKKSLSWCLQIRYSPPRLCFPG